MATVTGGGLTTFINAGSNDVNGIAQTLANQITAGLGNGTYTRTVGPNPPSSAGVLTISIPGTTTFNGSNVKVDLVNGGSGSVTVVGAGGPGQIVLSDNENLLFFTNGGSGVVVTGDGNNLIGTPTSGGGGFNVTTGTGNDTVNGLTGNNTISAGAGNNLINTGQANTLSNNLVFTRGNDRVLASGGSGTDTVWGGGTGTLLINQGSKNLNYYDNGATGTPTIFGGTGSDTVFLGSGGGSVTGGSGGNNVLVGGTSGRTTLFGGGNGDVLYARGNGFSFLIAGAGNETLTGAGSTANNIFVGGQNGNTTIGGGTGNDVIYIGNPGTNSAINGSAVVDGGGGNDIISFTFRAGSTESVLINNFHSSSNGENDRLQLLGYVNQQAAITTAAANAGSVTLTDGTRITFGTAVNLNASNFA